MTAEPWDDERIAAAFADRYDRPAPRELTLTTLEHVRISPRRPRWWPTVDRPRALGLASVVAVIAILAVLVMPRAGAGPGASATPSGVPSPVASPAQNTPYQSFPPSPAVAGFAALAAGLQVHAVIDAATLLADPLLADTELAFAGWYSASDLALGCQFESAPASPIEIRCSDVHAWLSATNRPILSATGSLDQPANPAGLIALRFVPPVDPPEGQGGPPPDAMITTPKTIVIVGHFNDERSVRCPADVRSTCQQTLVVDGVASASGELRDPSYSLNRRLRATRLGADQAVVLARAWVGSAGEILSVGLVRGSDAPWFDGAAKPNCTCPPTWFVRGYRILPADTPDRRGAGTPVAGWLTIDDATGAILGPLATDIPAPAAPFAFAPAPAGFPATIEGLPVRTVADVVDPDRPSDLPETPVAVAGWFTQLPVHPCPAGAADCNRETVVLAGSDKRLVTYHTNGPSTVVPPDGPILNPWILPGGATPPQVRGDGAPQPVVFIVHAGDSRADRQGPGDPVGPETFVLDQVAWLDGVDQPASVWIEPGIKPKHSPENALEIAGPIQFGRTWTVSISAVDAAHLRAIGSSMTTDAKGIVWLIRMVGSDPLDPNSGPNGWGTILVDDATGEFHSQWSAVGP